MRHKIFAGIGILWGGSIVVRWLLVDKPASANSAFQAGQNGAVIFGALMLVVGLYYYFKKPN